MKARFLSVLAMALALAALAPAQPKIAGKVKYEPHELVRLKADGVSDKAALLWRITPSKGTWRATTPKGVLEFSAVPGTFEVLLIAISQGPDGLTIDEATVSVEVDGCGGKLPPDPKPTDPPKPKDGKHDPLAAIGRVRFGNAGCTAAAIHPRRPDGRWDILCAAHCVTAVGERGTLTLKDGRVIGVRVASMDKTGDCAWFVTDESVDDMPYAKLAEKNPAVGVKVWHAGYGIDVPGNREDGEVQESENQSGQSRFLLSVSSGDSGGPVLRADTGEVVASVCCTVQRGAKVSMWGTSAANAAKHRPRLTAADAEAWVPALMPVRSPDPAAAPEPKWTPVDIPVRDGPPAERLPTSDLTLPLPPATEIRRPVPGYWQPPAQPWHQPIPAQVPQYMPDGCPGGVCLTPQYQPNGRVPGQVLRRVLR